MANKGLDISISNIKKFSKDKELSTFIKLLYSSVSSEGLKNFGPKELFKAAASTLTVLKEKGTQSYNVSYNVLSLEDDNILIQIAIDDMPFLVDSVINELKYRQIDINLICHIMVKVKRSKGGKFIAFDEKGKSEYVIQIHIQNRFQESYLEHLKEKIINILQCVQHAVFDWQTMLKKMREASKQLNTLILKKSTQLKQTLKSESVNFLDWLIDNHMVLLGMVDCEFKNNDLHIKNNSTLGILKSQLYKVAKLPYYEELLNEDFVIVRKWDSRSVVHRNVHMDVIIVKLYDNHSNIIGMRVFFGLFTSTVYYQSVRNIPLMRQKVTQVIQMYGYPESSHNCKELVTSMESFPRNELLQMSVEELYDTATCIVSLMLIPRVKLFLRQDPGGKFISCIIFMPEKKFSTDTRMAIESLICNKVQGVISRRYIQIGESALARLQLSIKLRGHKLEHDVVEEIEEEIIKTVNSWIDDFFEALSHHFSKKDLVYFNTRYGDAFDIKYQSMFSPKKAIHDIKVIEHVLQKNKVDFSIYIKAAEEQIVHFKIYSPDEEISLSSILPIMQNLGLKVIDVEIFHITVNLDHARRTIYLYHFRFSTYSNGIALTEDACHKAKEALYYIWDKKIDDDLFNGLIIAAGFNYRQVNLVRTYVKYLKQTKYPLSVEYTVQVLLTYPHISRDLVELFDIYLNPQIKDESNAVKLEDQINNYLNDIKSINEDKAIRSLLGVIKATLRTNFYQTKEDGTWQDFISIKLRSSDIIDLPLPKPYAEIYVYARDFEGLHLRGGKIARGGIRWSDRQEDFRAEVLGLMKAQMTKNSIIVPSGSKGGFILKNIDVQNSPDLMQIAIECYKKFLSGLLCITDNIVAGKIVFPKMVKIRDHHDPYLVVAADKGTATFSDYANGVAAQYNFWLGDAFASGGSAGYDHKELGITAKGAWISVMRHFQELKIDDQDFTCIGIGDMSGDVFGNGMLLSNKLKLVAAFNHSHIFLDPTPDPQTSYEERKRLFKKFQSKWSDYNPELISKGGAVFERKAKYIVVSKEVQDLLHLNVSKIAPDDLIRAILKADVDLIWNGGIGTYVKGSNEADDKIGDKANDNLRVTGSELKAKVVGEGGNLGFTQLGRIEYEAHGGRINTDFIDNSAGVDCSDHEVNIKIALSHLLLSGQLSKEDRDKELEKIKDEVCDLVLSDNKAQTNIITLEQNSKLSKINSHAWLIKHLENNGELNRAVEFLPSDEDLNKLITNRASLSRPEIAVLLSYAKNSMCSMIEEIDLTKIKYLQKYLLAYFPVEFAQKYHKEIKKHRLHKEIITTVLVNDFVNMLGSTFFHQLVDENNRDPLDVLKAFVAAREIFEINIYWEKVDALNDIPLELKLTLFNHLQSILGRNITWFLTCGKVEDFDSMIPIYKKNFLLLKEELQDLLTENMQLEKEELVSQFEGYKKAQNVAFEIAELRFLKCTPDIVDLAKHSKRKVKDVAQVFYSVGDKLYISFLIAQSRDFIPQQYFQILAIRSLINELYSLQMQLAEAELTAKYDIITANPQKFDKLDAYVKELKLVNVPEAFVSKILIAVKYLRELLN